ncbi:glycosyltransferase family 2 protein [Gammaproteobacteria bacterium]|nr:glycosyltransferase family 2 protein [Gammaproteobacteria bacterium]MDC1277350.1 glycosyltransferase family 2 protein [Gammaproteobacteria bacterium]
MNTKQKSIGRISASVVVYQNDYDEIKRAVLSFFQSNLGGVLYLIDNSPDNSLKILDQLHESIVYIFTGHNLGYGAGHNIAIKKAISKGYAYHVVLNPDVFFDENVLPILCEYMETNIDVGNALPKVVSSIGEEQRLAKLLPTPFDLLLRRFIPIKRLIEWRNKTYELNSYKDRHIINAPSLSGCFMFLRIAALQKVGIFDEKFFMYLEDVDLNRRIHSLYKTHYYPKVSIYHRHDKGSYKNWKLMFYHVKSAIQYFNKWGWFVDFERKKINDLVFESEAKNN